MPLWNCGIFNKIRVPSQTSPIEKRGRFLLFSRHQPEGENRPKDLFKMMDLCKQVAMVTF